MSEHLALLKDFLGEQRRPPILDQTFVFLHMFLTDGLYGDLDSANTRWLPCAEPGTLCSCLCRRHLRHYASHPLSWTIDHIPELAETSPEHVWAKLHSEFPHVLCVRLTDVGSLGLRRGEPDPWILCLSVFMPHCLHAAPAASSLASDQVPVPRSL